MEPGQQIQQYVFVEKLGEGGMAEVWKATDSHLDDFVAIKFLLPHIARVAELQERFRNEGKRQAQLKHKNIVHVRQYLEHEGQFFLVMDFLEGGGLDKYLDSIRGPLSVEEALRIALPVLSALTLAHSKGVVHRDISPQNVLLDHAGVPHLMDFGIAMVLGHQRVTRTGTVMGKPHYMSPEQILRPSATDHRTDIYSFGVMLYEILAGSLPFDADEGDVEHLVKNMHLNTPAPSLRDRNPRVPEAIEAVVLCTLEKDPNLRPQTCQALADALVQAEAGVMPELPNRVKQVAADPQPAPPPVPVPPAPPPVPPDPKPAFPMASAVAALVLAGGAAGYWYFTNNDGKPEGGDRVVVEDQSRKEGKSAQEEKKLPPLPTPEDRKQKEMVRPEAPAPVAPKPVIAFAADPGSTGFDGTSTVRWRVRNAQRVLLDGRPVEPEGEVTRRNLTADAVVVLTVIDSDGNSTRVPVTIHVASAAETAIEACTKLGLSAARCRKNWDECRASGISEKRCLDQSK